MRHWILGGLLLIQGSACAQLNKWLVRRTAGEVHVLDLTQTPPVVGPVIPGFGTGGSEDVNLMTDASDNIIFAYAVDGSDLMDVRDASFNVMPNGAGLFSNNSGLESCITPVPCHPDRYYIVHRQYETTGGRLYYTEVDMALNGGLGDVTGVKNVYLGDGITEGFAITRQTHMGCRWLFACHRLDAHTYEILRYLINDQGIGPAQVVATLPMISTTQTYTEIELTTAMDRLALSTPNTDPNDPDIVQWMMDLDSGTLSAPQPLSVCDQAVLGIEYSPLDQWLYWQGNTNGPTKLGRISTSTWTNEVISTSLGPYRRSMEEGGNGRIYTAGDYYTTSMDEIAVPDDPSLSNIGYTPNAIYVDAGDMRTGLPNAIEGEHPGTAAPTGYIAFSATAVGGCDTYQFTDSTCLGTWWEWNMGDGTVLYDEAPQHQFAAGTYDITLRVVACGDTLSLTKPAYITSTSAPVSVSFTATPDTVCVGEAVDLQSTSTNTTTYQWQLGDGATAGTSDLSHTYGAPGAYVVHLVAGNACSSDSTDATVVVLGTQAVAVIGADPCQLGITAHAASLAGSQVWWDLGDGTQAADSSIAHTYASPGQYDVVLITTPNTSCADTATTTITVGLPPEAAFSTTTACDGLVTFANTSQGAVSDHWTFGDGGSSNAVDATHSYPDSGPYGVVLVVMDANGCADTATASVTPTLLIAAGFDVTGANCAPMRSFTSTGSGTTDLQWSFGDGGTSSDTEVDHTYPGPGTYTVSLIAAPGGPCADTATADVHIATLPMASFMDSLDCDGHAYFTSTSTDAEAWSWDLGDGALAAGSTVEHAYAAPGSYTPVLIATSIDDCTDTVRGAILVPPPLSAAFSATFDPCVPAWSFVNASAGATSWNWDLGDGTHSTLPFPQHTYATPGLFTVTLVALREPGCSDTARTVLSDDLGDVLSGLFVPNCFTPNGDGLNPRFLPMGDLDCFPLVMRIYDRWGELIFTDEARRGWDGRVNGSDAPEGTYVYVLESRGVRRSGMVTLLR